MVIFPAMIIAGAVILEYSGLDLWWESLFFDSLSHSWLWRENWLFQGLLHKGGRFFDLLAAGTWCLLFAATILDKNIQKYRKPLLYFLCAAISGPFFVGILKHITHIYTPWDIIPFSGPLPYIHLFDAVPEGLPVGEAFPAGHASGGYAFVSLYFFLHQLGVSKEKYGLAAGVFLGAIFGFAQQARGAHFPSHDLFTMAICWYGAFFIYFLFYPKQWKALFNDRHNFKDPITL